MLRNGLGSLLRKEVGNCQRFVDLFTGSGAVAGFVATSFAVPVRAVDIQSFSVALAKAVITRTADLDVNLLWTEWIKRAEKELKRRRLYTKASEELPSAHRFSKAYVAGVRQDCEAANADMPLTRAYGGHYFSRSQVYWLDALRRTLPKNVAKRDIALASLIAGASQCVASPGHTAQPFQPTASAKKFLYEAWSRSLLIRTQSQLKEIAQQFAKVRGSVCKADANKAASDVTEGDIVFIDPPYSGVHYSRFYHVLETVCRGKCSEVSGVGRYPPPRERPRSRYSVQTESREAISELLKTVAANGATAIVTFPDKRCSNGISSYYLRQVAEKAFATVECKTIKGRFSTLGGDGSHRDARQASQELVMVLRP